MAYQALYRKYRLKTFDDMVGQEHISETISNAIIQEKISHAYLFAGPRGTGKTSIAKLVARAVNCVGEDLLCGVCEVCKSILNNEDSDIIEIDAASNNGVDEIREIRDKVKYAPSFCKYKVYIIDEVHMLTTQAFNALLKTLEEPPSHVIFILATTEPHKLPLTILSRCQRFDFRKISENSIVERLNTVVECENILVSNEALKLIAYLSDGGMRDALSLLDQVSSHIESEITVDDVYLVTGVASKEAVERIIGAVISKDKYNALKSISSLNDSGKDLYKLCDSMITYLRDGLVSANGISDDLIYRNSELFDTVRSLGIDNLYKMISFLNEISYKMKFVNNVKIFLEVSVLNLMEILGDTSAQMPNAVETKQQVLETSVLKEEISPTTNQEESVESINIEEIEDIKRDVEDQSILNSTEDELIEEESSEIEEEYENADAEVQGAMTSMSQEDVESPDGREVEETLEPDFDEENVVIDSKMKRKYHNYLRGVRINNTLARAQKSFLITRSEKWLGVNDLDIDMELIHLKSILTGAKLRAASDDHVVMSVESDIVVSKLVEDIEEVEKIVEQVTGEKLSVAIISKYEWDRIKGEYVERLKAGKPYSNMEEKSINEYFGIEDKGDSVLKEAMDYFGEDMINVEE